MMNMNNYLSRIGISDEGEATMDYLQQLQYRHVTQIPFENMDILQEIPLSLNSFEIYEKIVTRRRGGVCYELNGLFHVLLRELGFSVSMVAATVNVNGSWFKEGTHATNLVQLGGLKYLVDVGFGGQTPRRPIPLTGEEIQDADGYYRVRSYPEEAGQMILEKKETEWTMLYKFSLQARVLADFENVCLFTQNGEESKFNKKLLIMIVTDQGRATLSDHSLTIVNGKNKIKETIEPEALQRIIQETFKIG
ncbi:arylamine N-acetyltransferase [Paenibacillus sp. GCM10027628]|uniref:arylamine N-acetyltransferase family protein n=1 Tax=Paenibacillus sp. GCM10027628 TaxID=3273413 RepID=UPI00362AA995